MRFHFFFCRILGRIFCRAERCPTAGLKNKIENLRNQIQQYQKEIYSKGQQEETLQGDIADLEKDIAKIELQIQETQLVIQSLDLEIADKQSEIDAMQKKSMPKKKFFRSLCRNYMSEGRRLRLRWRLEMKLFPIIFSRRTALNRFEERTREIYDQFVLSREGSKRKGKIWIIEKEEQMNLQAMQKNQEQRSWIRKRQAKNFSFEPNDK